MSFLSSLWYPTFTTTSLVMYHIKPYCNSIYNWLVFGKLPENPIVTPSTSTQFITASGPNKYLQSVTVEPIPTTPTGA